MSLYLKRLESRIAALREAAATSVPEAAILPNFLSNVLSDLSKRKLLCLEDEYAAILDAAKKHEHLEYGFVSKVLREIATKPLFSDDEIETIKAMVRDHGWEYGHVSDRAKVVALGHKLGMSIPND